VGHVLEQEDWEIVRFPAIAEDDEAQLIDTVWGPKLLTRRQGDALHPAREPLPMLEHLRQMIGECPPGHFVPGVAGQYQQALHAIGRRPGQGGLVQALCGERAAPELRAHRAELGPRQQGDRAQ